MDYAQQQRNPTKHLIGMGVVVVFHVILVWALVNGLARKVIEVVKGPLETKIIQEVKPPPPEAPPPPPPKFAPPPPDFIPPPEVNIAVENPPPSPIANTSSKPQPPAPAAPAAPSAAHVPPVVKAGHCREPEYPPASERLGEEGRVVLQLLVNTDGKVIDSKVETSSGHPRLDEAARAALSLCKFTPGSFQGQPEQAWGRIAYVFKDPNR
jgi:periplasmic protein TonB